jgi:hypothetical protein
MDLSEKVLLSKSGLSAEMLRASKEGPSSLLAAVVGSWAAEDRERGPHIQRRVSTYIKNTADTVTIDPSTATTTNGIAPSTLLHSLRESLLTLRL